MRTFLNKKYLLIIILFISCNQTPETKNDKEIKNEPIEAIFEVPIKLDEDFISKNKLDDWFEFKNIEAYIFILANSISGYLENDYEYLTDTINSLGNYSSRILNSKFQLYNERPEIKGRLKLLNIQIQNTKINLNKWSKEKGLEELNKIFVFYNYTIKTIQTILDDSTIN